MATQGPKERAGFRDPPVKLTPVAGNEKIRIGGVVFGNEGMGKNIKEKGERGTERKLTGEFGDEERQPDRDRGHKRSFLFLGRQE